MFGDDEERGEEGEMDNEKTLQFDDDALAAPVPSTGSLGSLARSETAHTPSRLARLGTLWRSVEAAGAVAHRPSLSLRRARVAPGRGNCGCSVRRAKTVT